MKRQLFLFSLLMAVVGMNGCKNTETKNAGADSRINSDSVKSMLAENFGPGVMAIQKEIVNLGDYPAYGEFESKTIVGQSDSLALLRKLVNSSAGTKAAIKNADLQKGVELLKELMSAPLFKELFNEANVAERSENSIAYHLKASLCEHIADLAAKDSAAKITQSCSKLLEEQAFQLVVDRKGADLMLRLKGSMQKDLPLVEIMSVALSNSELKAVFSLAELRSFALKFAKLTQSGSVNLEQFDRLVGKISFSVGFGKNASCLAGERFCVAVNIDERVELSAPAQDFFLMLEKSAVNQPLFYGSPQANNEVVSKFNVAQLELMFKDFTSHVVGAGAEVLVPTHATAHGNVAYFKNLKVSADNSFTFRAYENQFRENYTDYSGSFLINEGTRPWENIAFSPSDYYSYEMAPATFELMLNSQVEVGGTKVEAKMRLALHLKEAEGKGPVIRLGTSPVVVPEVEHVEAPALSNPDIKWIKAFPKEMGMAVMLLSSIPATNSGSPQSSAWLDRGMAQIEMSYELGDDVSHKGTTTLNIPTGYCWLNERIDFKQLFNS